MFIYFLQLHAIMKKLIKAGALTLILLSHTPNLNPPEISHVKISSPVLKTHPQSELVELKPNLDKNTEIFTPENPYSHLETSSTGSELEKTILSMQSSLPKNYKCSFFRDNFFLAEI